jgi:hypothetical protein
MGVLRRFLNIIICLSILLVTKPPEARAIKEPSNPLVKLNAKILSSGTVSDEGIYLPRALVIPVELLSPIDTRVNKVSDAITAKTTTDIIVADHVLIPANSFLHGYISQLSPAQRMHKAPQVELNFQNISIPDFGKNIRKEIKINGIVKAKDILTNSDKVNDNEPYKKRLIKTGGAAGLGAGLMAYAITESVSPFASFGIERILSGLTILGAAGTGVYVASSLLTKDDIRMEAGTKLNVILSEESLSDFNAYNQTEPSPELEASPEELYDRMGEFESLPIK